MKKLVTFVSMILLVAFLASCTQGAAPATTDAAAGDTVELTAKEQWLQTNQLGA